MNTINQVNNTLNQTMSLLDLNFQINKLSSKAIIEWIRSFGDDLSQDIMIRIREMHSNNIDKEAPQDTESIFNMFQEIIQESLEERIELLKLDIPTKKRGRVAKKKKASVKDVVAVEDSDDEAPKKRGRKKKEVVEETTTDAMNELGLKTITTTKKKSKSLKKPKSTFKVFRRMEKMVEKPKHSGKYKKAVPWRKPNYVLKDGEKWLDTWSIAEKAPKKGSVTFDHEPTADELANFNTTTPVVVKKPVEKPVEKPKPVVLKKQPALVENPEEMKEASEVKETVKELVEEELVEEELAEEEYVVEDESDDEAVEEELPTVVSSFTPKGQYDTFDAIDGEEHLIYYNDKEAKHYGLVLDSRTGEFKGYIADENADELVDERPTYEHEEEDWENDEELGGIDVFA